MRRTNIYLGDDQLTALRSLGERRGVSVAELVREAVDAWLAQQGVRTVAGDEWQRRFNRLLERRGEAARRAGVSAATVEHDVARAVAEVRTMRAASRR